MRTSTFKASWIVDKYKQKTRDVEDLKKALIEIRGNAGIDGASKDERISVKILYKDYEKAFKDLGEFLETNYTVTPLVRGEPTGFFC